MADAGIANLQTTLRRYASAARFSPPVVDGVWGPNTRAALNTALRWLVDNTAIDQSFRSTAAQHQSQHLYDSANVAERTLALATITLFLSNVANSLGLKETTGTTTLVRPPVNMPDGSGAPKPGLTTDPMSTWTPPKAAATISVLGLKMPSWALYVGGGVLALMVVGIVATRKKPVASAPVNGPGDKVNREGLTWEEWRDAAKYVDRTGMHPEKVKAWRRAWTRGVDPAEMAER